MAVTYLWELDVDNDEGNNYAAAINNNGNSNSTVRGKAYQENSNLLNMKRLSFPTFNLHEEEKVLPPFMEYSTATQSRLDTAAKFGAVVRGFRKPGHHIPGPTKNPSCPCDHCRMHFETKEGGTAAASLPEEKGRTRAHSLDQANSRRSQSSEVVKKNNLND